jgi:sec-independent protein translocase protein TatB
MLDIGWTELMVIGVLALLVVGPKELPRMMRTVGQFVGKARGLAREFQRSMDEAAREADLKELTDLKRDVEKLGRVDFKSQARKSAESLVSGGKPKAGDQAKATSTFEKAKAAGQPKPAADPKPSGATAAQPDPGAPKPAPKTAAKTAVKTAAKKAPKPAAKSPPKTAAGDA